MTSASSRSQQKDEDETETGKEDDYDADLFETIDLLGGLSEGKLIR